MAMKFGALPHSHTEGSRLPASTALISIFGSWLFYAIIVTLRVSFTDIPAQDEMALRRLYVTFSGMGITILLWLCIRPFDAARLTIRIAVAALAALPAAFAIAGANYYFFNLFDPEALIDIVDMKDHTKPAGMLMVEITEVALSRYFFLIAWAALYLALGYAFSVRQTERRLAEVERAAQLAELRALRYQLNPHFLFNTLNSLSALVMAGRKDDAEKMILNLSDFYRSNLTADATGDVPLSEEIATQQLYLDIERARFPGRLITEFDIGSGVETMPVPGLILQPLIENAIKHGVSRTSKPVTILVTARAHGGRLHISVSDNAGKANSKSKSGIGISNVRDRLQTRFGEESALAATPTQDGFETRISFPVTDQ